MRDHPARPSARRLGAVLLVAGAVLFTAACATGQDAQTSKEQPAIDGGEGTAGMIHLDGVALHAPLSNSYPAGSSVALSVVMTNNGDSADTLVNVTSPAFTGWGITRTTPTTGASTAPATGQTVAANSAVSLGLQDIGNGTQTSSRTVLMTGLTKSASPLFPGTSVDITFRFADAGATTVAVPVQVTDSPSGLTIAPGPDSEAP